MIKKFTVLFIGVMILGFATTVAAADDDDQEYKFKFYGYIKLDASWDDSRVDIGNFHRWVLNEAVNENDAEFNMTARQTRLGVNIFAPKYGNMVASGKVEIDFFEGGAENKPRPMIRHAYMSLRWPDEGFEIIAGQTWDLFSPLNPSTVNYSVAWWQGNIGYRRPQIRLTKTFDTSEGTFTAAVAIARTIGHDYLFDPGDTGEDADYPGVQWKLAYAHGKNFAVGVSGHWAQEEYDLTADGETTEDIDSWSFNIDAMIAIWKHFAVKGEYYTGTNMDAYLGGIGQGVNLATLESVDSTGFWAALSAGPFDAWRFNFGYAMDDPEDEDLWAGARAENMALWGNTFYAFNKAASVGFEVSHLETKYVDSVDSDALRLQTAFIFAF